jgi:ribonuclease Z
MLAVTILGNNSAVPTNNRHPTSQVVTVGNNLLLLDCGEGTQIQMIRYQIRRRKISHIFISHLHGDHYYGLVGLLNSFALLGRLQPLVIYGPPLLEKIVRMQIEAGENRIPFELNFYDLKEGELVNEPDFKVTAFKTEHRITCFGFLIEEKRLPFRINGVALEEYQIPTSQIEGIRHGKDVTLDDGTVVLNNVLSLPNSMPKKYAFCADTRVTDSFLKVVQNVDLMYHETTYLHHLAEQAYERFHSTTKQAAAFALKANAQKLIIGHFSSKYDKLDELLEEATSVFENTALATEGTTFYA